MRIFRGYSLGIFLGIVTIVGCAAVFPYKYYSTQMDSACYDNSTLLGKTGGDGWQDLSMKECKPDSLPSPGASPTASPVLLRCITMKVDDFYALKADDETCHARLQACEHGPAPTQ